MLNEFLLVDLHYQRGIILDIYLDYLYRIFYFIQTL
jgi:hypothetical protein